MQHLSNAPLTSISMTRLFYFTLISALCTTISCLCMAQQVNTQSQAPVKIAIAGLTHTHVHWLLGREARGDIELVGIAEPNRELAQQYSKQHGYSMDIVYDDLSAMLEATQPEAVCAFNDIYGHLEVVRQCAP